MRSTESRAIGDQERPSHIAVALKENVASVFAKEIAGDLILGSLQTQSITVGERTFGVEYDKRGQFQRVGSLFYVNSDLWLDHRDYFENKLGAYLPNLIALPLETYNMPRESFLSFHAVLLIAKMMSIDLKDKLVIDLGCGQGTLTLTALKLGAKRVVGIDQNPTLNESIFSAQGIRLGKREDAPSSYDILFAKGRIHKPAPPALLTHLEGARVLVANVGPTYESYFEMVPAWSSFPGLDTWLDGGHFKNTIENASAGFISHGLGWEIGDVWSGGSNGDLPQETPAAFEGRRIPPVREELTDLMENPSDQQELLFSEETLKDYWRRIMNSEGRDADALASLRKAGYLPEEAGIPAVLPNLARLEIAIWDAADRTSSLESLGIPVQAYVVGGRRIFFSEAWGDVDVLLSYQPDESLSEWIQPATVREYFFEKLLTSLPPGASLIPTVEGARVSWSDSKGDHLFELNVHPIPKNPVDAVLDSLPAWLVNPSRDPKALTLARLYYYGSLDEWGDYLAHYPNLPKPIGDNEKKLGRSDSVGEPGISSESFVGSNDGLRAQLKKRLSLPASVFPARTRKIEINNEHAAFVSAIGVSQRSVNDTLGGSDREVFSKALGAIAPTVFDMQGVEVLIDPRRVISKGNFGEELENKMGVNGGVVGEMSPEKLEGIIQQDPVSIQWVRGFSSKPYGVKALATKCVQAAKRGDAALAGAALAAWDDSKLLAGPNPEIVANLLAVLIGDKTTDAVALTDQFADAYNRVRAGLLFPKLLAGTLMKSSTGSEVQPGIILNISALFDQQAEDAAKNETWLALASVLAVRERNPSVPVGLVVHGGNVTEKEVEKTLAQSVPRWANFMGNGISLFVHGDTTGKTVFVDKKFSLNALRAIPLWNRPLNVLGLSAEGIAESVDQLESIELIPLDVFVNQHLQQVLQRVRFILRNA
ncbi:MAG: 50S ribosomal protein L11 methyltransferase [Elusimicrobia bacterium]|nr:50S ribosomal protein L11 methyltransferase [Elusimicrobiota bacterium]